MIKGRNTSGLFLWIVLAPTEVFGAKGVVAQATESGTYVAFDDVQKLQAFLILFAVGGLGQIISLVWGVYSKKNDKTEERLEVIETENHENKILIRQVLEAIKEVRANQLTMERVQDQVRKEIEYARKISRQ